MRCPGASSFAPDGLAIPRSSAARGFGQFAAPGHVLVLPSLLPLDAAAPSRSYRDASSAIGRRSRCSGILLSGILLKAIWTELPTSRQRISSVSVGRWGGWVERFADNAERARSGLTHTTAKVAKSVFGPLLGGASDSGRASGASGRAWNATGAFDGHHGERTNQVPLGGTCGPIRSVFAPKWGHGEPEAQRRRARETADPAPVRELVRRSPRSYPSVRDPVGGGPPRSRRRDRGARGRP